ncbi:phenylacetic acid degradation protein [Streptomyces pluripotens]|uniref:Phenylacetic acid degradation protein n=1 Tax=Streptomyces pluripotens TaxID=1355015 RepID=A0A221NZE4_9ACTN|nr:MULTISPECIES: 1,2-phenylacetyl-CoA epoxidase subunit PaaE [Streptomyces]ARP71135.1 phenylacetic acid degradation protein [Streptomyces pluripotens]ASN25383.1 phenylacetic acid degradation protein [Streptomyces pluripotens]KIE26016.1 phenylacetic acid degradation protein [Streptomyces sp. MUSC 125]MCH0557089.1 phenylacetate-CoA oxygenase/reductase subunit PaaK [Streptomyces sp. MUM 16J]
MARFHPLPVAAVDRLTDDSVALTFAVPPELREEYRHAPGQHLALRRRVDGAEIRRTYSICSPAPVPAGDGPQTLRVGIRLVEGGAFSTYALKEINVGDELEVMTPAGRFTLEPAPGHYVAIVGGSGITPVLSIVSTLLAREPKSRFCLIRSDRTAASTMFLEEVADLKDRYPERLQLVTVLSREEQQAGLPSGRLDRERLVALLPALLPLEQVAGWFLCGPYGLVQDAEKALRELDVNRARIHQEIFHVDAGSSPASAVQAPAHSTVTARLDGRGGTWPVREGESLLETVLRNRSDAPYACKGGVCGTCRAFLVSGEVRMDRNFALETEETEAGYVLACQSHPLTEAVELDFDR